MTETFGQIWYDTSTLQYNIWNGQYWIPLGVQQDYKGVTLPRCELLEDIGTIEEVLYFSRKHLGLAEQVDTSFTLDGIDQ